MDKHELVAKHWKSICKSGQTDLVDTDCEEPPEWCSYDDDALTSGGAEHLVLTDTEADKRAADYVSESLWAFAPWFLSRETGISASVFKAIQDNDQCESNNDAIACIVASTCGIAKLTSKAIEEDGRSHFLSGYDGHEREVQAGKVTLYFYRTN